MEVFNFLFKESPKVTKILVLTYIAISLLAWFEILSPLYLYLNYELVFKKHQIWRLVTNFLYFGEFSLTFLFHLFLLSRNSKFLEKRIFRGNCADYIHFLFTSGFILLLLSPLIGNKFLANSFSFAMTYYWGRKSKHTMVQVFGLINLRAPYLAWFYLALSFLMDSGFKNDFFGMIAGHIYFYFKDIFPRIKALNGFQIFKTPKILQTFCNLVGLNNEFVIEAEDDGLFF
ncbi:MAG: derlin [archaeon]|nr:derlin [archaeon]